MQLTITILKQISPRPSSPQKAAAWDSYTATLAGSDAAQLFDGLEISKTADRLAMLLANMMHESGGMTIVRENMNYSADRLPQVWPRWFRDPDFASQYAHNPRKLANYIYGSETTIGQNLGNTKTPEDGWDYRGGGLMQTTGRFNYRKFSALAGVDLEARPELIEAPIHSLRAGCAEWAALGLNAFADAGKFRACCNGINRGNPNASADPIGWRERKAWLRRCSLSLGIEPGSFGLPEEEPLDFDFVLSDDYPHGRDTEVAVDPSQGM
jgi:putative chitinase